jgi:hypothetical protein
MNQEKRSAMYRIAILTVAFAICTPTVSVLIAQTSVGPAAPDTWAPLRFLLGTWDGVVTGEPGKGESQRTYRLTLRNRFIEVRNISTYPPQQKNPKGEVHEDVGYLSFDQLRKAFVLRQFHVEGFANTYVMPSTAQAMVFTSEALENLPAGWRARETYRQTGADSFIEVFELAAPGKDFAVYSETRFTRRQ